MGILSVPALLLTKILVLDFWSHGNVREGASYSIIVELRLGWETFWAESSFPSLCFAGEKGKGNHMWVPEY
jgi:hypothetical protein